MKRETKFPWWGWVGILCLLPVVYLMSGFLVAWVLFQFDRREPEWFLLLYKPLGWAVDEWEWFGLFVERIAEWMGIT